MGVGRRGRTVFGLGVGGALGVVTACTVQTIFPGGSAPLPGSASQIVGAGGGIVTANDGTTLFIPAQALPGEVTITIGLDPDTVELPDAQALAAGHVFGPAGQVFGTPACVTMSFEPALLPQGTTETSVVLYASAEDGGGYAPVPTWTTDATHVTGTVSQLSTIVAGYGGVQELDASACCSISTGASTSATLMTPSRILISAMAGPATFRRPETFFPRARWPTTIVTGSL